VQARHFYVHVAMSESSYSRLRLCYMCADFPFIHNGGINTLNH
jgi:hypothetical protein